MSSVVLSGSISTAAVLFYHHFPAEAKLQFICRAVGCTIALSAAAAAWTDAAVLHFTELLSALFKVREWQYAF